MSSVSTAGLLVFCAVLASAFADQCVQCLSKTSTECQEQSTIDCPGRCMTASQHFHNGEVDVESFYKGCANESFCDQLGSLTEQNEVTIRVHATCCSGDECNADDKFNLPEEDSEPNGKKCPNAYCKGTTEECESTEEIECKGSETQCIEYKGTVENPDGSVDDYSAKGCVNPIGCRYNFDILLGVQENHRVLLKC